MSRLALEKDMARETRSASESVQWCFRQPHSGTTSAVTVLSGVVLAFYHRLWLPDLVLTKRDAFRFFLPLKQHMAERLAAGELPQWFPYESLGRPFLANPVTGVFHPFTLLYLAWPAHEAYRLSVLACCLVAALGAFLLGRALGCSRPGAVLAGIAFSLSGYVVSLSENVVYLYSACLLPMFCVALDKALASSCRWIAAPALLWASVFLNGDVQSGYYYSLVALLWTVARAGSSYRQAAIRLASALALTGLVAAVQLGPTAALYLDSNRTQAALFKDQALHWSTHPIRLLTMVASPVGGNAGTDLATLLYGSQSSTGLPGGLWAESLYVGIPIVGLALLAVWRQSGLRVLAVLGGLALLLSLGRYGGLYEVFYGLVPFWSAFRYPERLMGIASLALAVLAGAGFDAAREGHARLVPWLAATTLCTALWAWLRTDLATLWTVSWFGVEPGLAHRVVASASQAAGASLATAVGICVLIVGMSRGHVRTGVFTVLLLALVTVDLGRANYQAYHTGPAEAATFFPALAQELTRREGSLEPGRFRILSSKRDDFVYPESLDRWLDVVGTSSVTLRQALDVEHNATFHVESIKVYLPGYSTSVAALVASTQQDFGPEAYARYNVGYFIGRPAQFASARLQRALVARVPGYDLGLYTNPVPPWPRAYLSEHPVSSASPVSLPVLLERTAFLNGAVDVVETSEPMLPPRPPEGRAVMQRYDPEHIQVRVDSKQPAVLVLLDGWEPGWTAWLETGAELPILKANALVRAATVPAGTHVVTFRYRTPWLDGGAILTALGLLLCGLIVASVQRSSVGTARRSPDPNAGDPVQPS